MTEPGSPPRRAAIPWARVLAEGVIIVASILLAFAIDRSYERWQARAEERVALADLREDLRSNLSQLSSLHGRWAQTQADAVRAIEALADPSFPEEEFAALAGGCSRAGTTTSLARRP